MRLMKHASSLMNFLPHFILILILQMTICYAHDIDLDRKQFYVGPEWYHLSRTKEGGTKQKRTLFGGRIGFDRLKRYKWYIGAEASYAKNTLRGHSSSGDKLCSHFVDKYIEGRFGYTFQCKEWMHPSITPFVGYGTAREINNFKEPSPVQVHFKTHYNYVAFGFLSWIHPFCPFDCFELGLNFEAKYPLNPKCRVTHDEENEHLSQNIKSRMLYKVELPITYRITCDGRMALTAVPFYEWRVYGGHPNFPFNFIKTNIRAGGAVVEFVYRL